MHDDRRKAPRYDIPDQALALDDQGRTLGRVTKASAGGMQIEEITAAAIGVLQPGNQLRITVQEPSSGSQHSVRVVVRYVRGSEAGVEFVPA